MLHICDRSTSDPNKDDELNFILIYLMFMSHEGGCKYYENCN